MKQGVLPFQYEEEKVTVQTGLNLRRGHEWK